MTGYFDTSAIVKLLIHELDSELAEEFWGAARTRVASHLLYPEARAALAAAARGGRIDEAGLRAAANDLDGAIGSLSLVGVDASLSRTAGELAEAHGLRGYDAVHLATALTVDPTDFVLVTWDRELAVAARACGRSVAPAIS